MSSKYYQRLAASSGFTSTAFKSKYGANIMKQLGWSEGESIGLSNEGATECIQIKRRTEGAGLGADDKSGAEGYKGGQWSNWWEDMYNDVASSLPEKSSELDVSSSSDESSKSGSDDEATSKIEDPVEMLGKSRKKSKRAERQAGKMKRVQELDVCEISNNLRSTSEKRRPEECGAAEADESEEIVKVETKKKKKSSKIAEEVAEEPVTEKKKKKRRKDSDEAEIPAKKKKKRRLEEE